MGIIREAAHIGVDLLRVMMGAFPIESTPESTASKQRGGGDPARYPHLEWYRGTSRQTCGLYPFVASSSTPMVGVPVGKALDGTGTVCADPINWFETGLISAPSCMVLGLNGLGKSSLVRRMVIGLEAQGAHTMVLGDIKPDYRDVVEALGGQIIAIGHGRSGINPLDAGNADQAGTGPCAGALPARTAARPGDDRTRPGGRRPTARAASAFEGPRETPVEKPLIAATDYADRTQRLQLHNWDVVGTPRPLRQ